MKLKPAVFMTAIFASMALIGCGENKPESGQSEIQEEEKSEVTLSLEAIEKFQIFFEEVREGTITGVLKAPAKLMANQDYEAQVGSLVQGRVNKVFVREGEYVNKGQVLMLVEGLEIGEIKSAYLQAKATLDYAKAAYERQKTLFEQNVGSQKSLLESKAEYEKALAEYNAEDKRIHSIGLEHSGLDTTSGTEHIAGVLPINAPIRGIITERNVVIGQLVEANSTAFRIMDTNSLWAEGQIYEKDITKLSGKPKIEFIASAYPNEKFKGEVILIGQTVDEHSRTIKVRASLHNINNKLKPNMFGELFIPISANTKGITMPTDALVKEGNKFYVFLAVNDSTFKKQYVEPGVEFGGMVEIVGGLEKGERIVTKGVFFLKSELMKETFGEEE